jgi:hypothetical protein
VKIWDVNSGQETGPGGRLLRPVNVLQFSPDGDRLAALGVYSLRVRPSPIEPFSLDGEDGPLTILDGTTGAELASVRGGAGVGWLGNRFATTSNDGVVLWDALLARPQATLKESAGGK